MHPSCWACLPASNSFSFMAAGALLVRAVMETVVVGLQDAFDEFFDEAVQPATDAHGDNRSGADENVEYSDMLSEPSLHVGTGGELLCEEYFTGKCCEWDAEVRRTTKKNGPGL